jgi:hypothetical protein
LLVISFPTFIEIPTVGLDKAQVTKRQSNKLETSKKKEDKQEEQAILSFFLLQFNEKIKSSKNLFTF